MGKLCDEIDFEQAYEAFNNDVDKSKIWEDGDISASMYRVAVAHSLSHFDVLEKEPAMRGVHEGLLVHLDGAAAFKEETNDKVSAATL